VPPCPCPVCDRSLHARIRRPPSSTRFAYTTLFRSTNQTVCAGNIIQLNGAIGGAATSQTWYKNIVNPSSIVGTSLSEIYTPTPTELQNGATINFILVTDDPPGLCPAASSTVTVVINQRPTVDAGSNTVVCSGEPVLLNGTFGATATSVTWSGGAGSFSDPATE